MAINQQIPQSMIGEAALKMTRLPTDQLPLVIRFLDSLEQLQRTDQPPRSVDEILDEAWNGSESLRDVPREQLMARFLELGEEIRQEAIRKGTAIEGDWIGD